MTTRDQGPDNTASHRAGWVRVLPLMILLCVSGRGPLGAAQSETAPASAPLEGRLLDGADGFAERALAEAHLFAVSPMKKSVLSHTRTSKAPGPEKGTWRLDQLPAEGEIILIGFHDKARTSLWIQRYTLTGRYNDLSLHSVAPVEKSFVADPAMKALWFDLHRAGWVKDEATVQSVKARAAELVDALLATLPKDPVRK